MESRKGQTYRPDIDGLRAVAVLSVVLFHAFPAYVKGGFVGVDVFFVISGFLISGIIFRALDEGHFSFAGFYARRIRRIFPALLIVLGACLAAGWFILLSDEYAQLSKHIVAGMGFVSNILLWKESGYFDKSAALKPLLHLWSLGIEEQFYIAWPVLLCLAGKNKRVRLYTISAVFAASFLWNVTQVRAYPVSTYYLPISRAWELLLGSYLAYFEGLRPELESSRLMRWLSRLPGQMAQRHAGSVTGFVLILASIVSLDSHSHFPGWPAVLPTLGALMVLSAGPEAWINKRLLSLRPMVFVGLISFPLYLWHWPLISFSRIVVSAEPTTNMLLVLISVSFVLAWLTYLLWERPIRAISGPGTPIGLLLAGVLVACFGGYVVQQNGLGSRFRPNTLASAKGSPTPKKSAIESAQVKTEPSGVASTSLNGIGQEVAAPTDPATATQPSAGPGPSAKREMAPVAGAEPTAPVGSVAPPRETQEEIYAREQEQFLWTEKGYNATATCLKRFNISGGDDKCLISDEQKAITVALLGDSHANSIYFGLARYYALQGENLAGIGRGGCLPFWDVNSEGRTGDPTTKCKDLMNSLLDHVETSTNIHTVLLADRGAIYLDGGLRPVTSADDPADTRASQIYERALRATIARLLAANKNVVLVIDQPDLAFDPRTCLARPMMGSPAKSPCAAPAWEVEARMQPYKSVILRVLNDFQQVSYLDLTPVFCDKALCWASRDGQMLYRDGDHLSFYGSMYLFDKITIRKGFRFSPNERYLANHN